MTDKDEKIYELIKKAFKYGRIFERSPESFGEENDIIFEIYNTFMEKAE